MASDDRQPVDLDEARELIAQAAAWKPDESDIVSSVMSATFLLMGAEGMVKRMADELAQARAELATYRKAKDNK